MEASTTQQIPVDKIVPSPFQARKNFDEQALKELAQTIKDRGLENAIIVRPVGDKFELIAGERRWRAVKLLGWQTIEAKVEAVDDREAYLRGLVENVQREDLSPIEQARAYRRLTQEPFNLKQDSISQLAGKDQSLISKYLSVAGVGGEEPANYELFINLGLTHLIELSRLTKTEDQVLLARQATKEDMSAKQLKALVDRKIGKKSSKKRREMKVGNDPLAELWPSLIGETTEPTRFWGVTYGPQQIPGIGATVPAWHFWVQDPGMSPKEDLKTWFERMLDAFRNSKEPAHGNGTEGSDNREEPSNHTQSIDSSVTAAPPNLMPSGPEEFEKMEQEQKNMRLPASDREKSELEALAKQGPAAVYAWIFGADSLMAKKVAGASWADLGMTDPVSGVRQLIDGLRAVGIN